MHSTITCSRNQSFVEREHAFIASSSHELRTPIAVIAGAAELALEQADVPAAARNQVARIHRTARKVEQLISLLLTLAKDPARLADSSDRVALDQLLPDIIEDHRHLTRDKDLALVLGNMPPCEIVAPVTDRAGRHRQPAAQRHREQRPRRDTHQPAGRTQPW